ncbi:hypothetical protein AGMMS4957_20420 [Bacteroidia bacterium]|nr:hypothetical protein AGMMS4957_20420 [Bacteroidia bacterium]
MTMNAKVYTVKRAHFFLPVLIDGQEENLRFVTASSRGGDYRATYRTLDEKKQKAIEETKYFDTVVFLESSTPVMGETETVEEAHDEISAEDLKQSATFPDDLIYKEITNPAEAKRLLIANYKIDIPKNAPSAKVVEESKKLGLIFPNWESYNA